MLSVIVGCCRELSDPCPVSGWNMPPFAHRLSDSRWNLPSLCLEGVKNPSGFRPMTVGNVS